MNNEDKIIQKLFEHDERFERIEINMFTKNDSKKMIDLLEGLVTLVKKIQDDHTFALEWLKRLQDHYERQEEDIKKIKMYLKLA